MTLGPSFPGRWSRRDILGGILGSGLLAATAACGSRGRRQVQAPAEAANHRYAMAFNGGFDPSGFYNIGMAFSPDSTTWTESTSNPILTGSGGAHWDSQWVKDPCLLSARGRWLLYYAGSSDDGESFQIGLATSSSDIRVNRWNRSGAHPVLAVGDAGQWDSYAVRFPFVLFDVHETDPGRAYKMWYAGQSSEVVDAETGIGYAYASHPAGPFTKFRGNPVLTPGRPGSCDGDGVTIPVVLRESNTGSWYMFYDGRYSSTFPYRWTTCLASFTDPEATYSKSGSNPLVSGSTASQALTADTARDTSSFLVESNAAFTTGEPLQILHAATGTIQTTAVEKLTGTTGITTTRPATVGYTTSDSISSLYYDSVGPKSILHADGSWILFGTAYQEFPGLLNERACAWTASSLNGPWKPDYDRGAMLPLGPPGSWNPRSSENPSVVTIQSIG